MEQENKVVDDYLHDGYDRAKDDKATENSPEIKYVTAEQHKLIRNLMKSRKILDKEYRGLVEVLDSKVVTTLDASIFIEHVLSLLRFRRNFFNGKHKAYKQCKFCNSREKVQRYALATDLKQKAWVCETCALNLPDKVVPVSVNENGKQ